MVHGETQWASWRIYFNSSLSGTHTRTHAHAHTHIHARNPQRGAIIPSSTYGRTDTRSNFLKYWLARVKEKVINERCPSSPLHGFSSRGTFSSINPPNCLNIALSAQPSRRREPRSAKCRPWSGTRSTVLRGSAFSEFLADSLAPSSECGRFERERNVSFPCGRVGQSSHQFGKICFATVPVQKLTLIRALGGQLIVVFEMGKQISKQGVYQIANQKTNSTQFLCCFLLRCTAGTEKNTHNSLYCMSCLVCFSFFLNYKKRKKKRMLNKHEVAGCC